MRAEVANPARKWMVSSVGGQPASATYRTREMTGSNNDP